MEAVIIVSVVGILFVGPDKPQKSPPSVGTRCHGPGGPETYHPMKTMMATTSIWTVTPTGGMHCVWRVLCRRIRQRDGVPLMRSLPAPRRLGAGHPSRPGIRTSDFYVVRISRVTLGDAGSDSNVSRHNDKWLCSRDSR